MAVGSRSVKLDASVKGSARCNFLQCSHKCLRKNEISYSAAISACEKGGQWQTALNLLSLMHQSRVVPNVISYSAAIRACETGCQWQLALILLILNPLSKVLPDAISYDAAIRACQKGGQWQSALDLLSLMPQAKVVADLQFLTM
eukprot:TRINITY_DN6135_c0_g1_i9.p1 TRINITY_DN6135_c0_g1~~TRINITY_DN6135_c0_g1_i9.p1  ORF type:complete len:145 (+),score=13.01 TRINITY_DN6135_c0_g1_i9:237-671(+)